MLGPEAMLESMCIALSELEVRALIDSWVPDTDAGPEVDNKYFNATIIGNRHSHGAAGRHHCGRPHRLSTRLSFMRFLWFLLLRL